VSHRRQENEVALQWDRDENGQMDEWH